jgi:WD40 repeat protein
MDYIYLNFIYWFIGECIATLRGHDDEVLDVVFDSTGQYIATASADKTGRVYDGLSQLCIATLTGHQAEISKVKFFFWKIFRVYLSVFF